jgi:hypothetical protein
MKPSRRTIIRIGSTIRKKLHHATLGKMAPIDY